MNITRLHYVLYLRNIEILYTNTIECEQGHAVQARTTFFYSTWFPLRFLMKSCSIDPST